MSEVRNTPRTSGPRDAGVSRFALRLWNGMTLSAWLRLMKGNWGKVSAVRYPAVAVIFLTTGANQIRKWIGQVFVEPRVRRVTLEPAPIFIIGHWRSGTTWLHQTMLADPGFAAPTMQACFTPECFLVGRRALTPILRRLFPTSRPMDNVPVGLAAPEEDEHAILLSGAFSPYRGLLLACDPVPGAITRTEDMPADEAEFWRRSWLAFLRRVQFANPGKRLVLKSPAHTARIAEILRLFPDARFIHILRDPYRIFASVRKTNAMMTASQSLQTCSPSQEDIEAGLFTRFMELHNAFESQSHLIPEGHLVTIRYEDLKADSPGVMRSVYQTLGLGDFGRVAAHYEAEAARSRDYKTNVFTLEPEIVSMIEERWKPYFDRHGYSPMADRSEGGQ